MLHSTVSEFLSTLSAPFFSWVLEPPNWIGNLPKKGVKLLVLDSSFNPPTLAHMEMVLQSHKSFPGFFHASILLLSLENMDKSVLVGASHSHRLCMMSELTLELSSVGNIGVGVTSAGRFVDKTACIKRYLDRYLDIKDAELYFLVGIDTAIRIFDGKYYNTSLKDALEPLFTTSSLLVADRSGFEKPGVEFWKLDLVKYYVELGKISRIPMEADYMSISSTKARASLVDAYDILPASVLQYLANYSAIYQ